MMGIAEETLKRHGEKRYRLLALEMRNHAIAPYSNFPVGAVLLAKSGITYTGVNIEGSAYGLTMCAERTALFKALSEGERDFTQLYIATDTDDYVMPCGACRQMLWDYAHDIEIISVNKEGEFESNLIKELLPKAFDKRSLNV